MCYIDPMKASTPIKTQKELKLKFKGTKQIIHF